MSFFMFLVLLGLQRKKMSKDSSYDYVQHRLHEGAARAVGGRGGGASDLATEGDARHARSMHRETCILLLHALTMRGEQTHCSKQNEFWCVNLREHIVFASTVGSDYYVCPPGVEG